MITKLIIGVTIFGVIVLTAIAYEVRQIRRIKISEDDINNCFKGVDKWRY